MKPSFPMLRCMRVLAVSVAAWTLLCAVGALSSYGDAVRYGVERPYGLLLWNWWRAHVPMMVLSAGLYLALSGAQAQLGRAGRLLGGYALVLALFLPLNLVFVAWTEWLKDPPGPGPVAAQVWAKLFAMSNFSWFTEFAWTTFTYAAVTALCIWRQHRLREQAWQRERADNLALRLALEQQRLQALRGQLEPHFIFNALNAISALVRMDDKRVALTGIARLSDLLRYATAASTRDWVSMEEELQFVRDYLALQHLRYGERLHVAIEGDDAMVRGADTPPLLLQPLVENALRHGLDCHAGEGSVTIRFERRGERLAVRIANPAPAAVAASSRASSNANPGLGIGLANTRTRLQMAYGDAASLRTWREAEVYVAEIVLPLARPEAS
jgi:two-component system sensor histidine kinase AlgZ